jgi:hypothetical protein
MTTVLADCPNCDKQVEAEILDCDDCFQAYIDLGGDPAIYDGDQECKHLECLTCEASVGA